MAGKLKERHVDYEISKYDIHKCTIRVTTLLSIYVVARAQSTPNLLLSKHCVTRFIIEDDLRTLDHLGVK